MKCECKNWECPQHVDFNRCDVDDVDCEDRIILKPEQTASAHVESQTTGSTSGRDMIEGFIREDLPKLETHELTKAYKFIRGLIAETN